MEPRIGGRHLSAALRLYRILGWSALVGLSSICISYVALHLLAKRSLALTRTLMSATDRRISVISELVSAIRFLKYYAWEKVSQPLDNWMQIAPRAEMISLPSLALG